jgi:hypothetical protein
MLFINPKMIEPTTLSIGIYIISKTPTTLQNTHKYFNRNPLLVKKKLCKWILRHNEPLRDTIIDEYNDQLLYVVNLIKINPSIFLLLYIIALLVIIIF